VAAAVRARHRSCGELSGADGGVPPWLDASITRWVMERAARGASRNLHLSAERALRVQFPIDRYGSQFQLYWDEADEPARLALLDFLLHDLEERQRLPQDWPDRVARQRVAESLGRALVEGGSAWAVTLTPAWGLVRRESEGSQLAVGALDSSTDAGRRAASAWYNCFRNGLDYDKV